MACHARHLHTLQIIKTIIMKIVNELFDYFLYYFIYFNSNIWPQILYPASPIVLLWLLYKVLFRFDKASLFDRLVRFIIYYNMSQNII